MCFFSDDTATPETYTLSLHDALPILSVGGGRWPVSETDGAASRLGAAAIRGAGRQNAYATPASATASAMPPATISVRDRKSTRLNSSHTVISYAVFCLKKKNNRSHNQ